jgi:hypothetical protein
MISFGIGTEIVFRGLYGVIDFVCEQYVVMECLPFDDTRKPARLVIYPSQFEDVKIAKSSTK